MTWNRETVQKKVVEVFTKHRQMPVDVDESTRIVADLGIDSLGVMDVLAEVEDAFGLLIPDEALKTIESVGDVSNAIVERLGQDGRLSE